MNKSDNAMTYEEFKKEYNILEDQIQKIRCKQSKLKQKYIKILPVQEDDRIVYDGKNYWVTNIELFSYSQKVNISVNPMKKDGTRGNSKKILWAVDFKDIEVICKCGKL